MARLRDQKKPECGNVNKSNSATAKKSPKRLFMIGHELGCPIDKTLESYEHPAGDIKVRQKIAEQVRECILVVCRENGGKIIVNDLVEVEGNETELEFAYIVIIVAFKDESCAILAEQQVRATSEIYGVWIKDPHAKARWGSFTILDFRLPSLEEVRLSIQRTCQAHDGRLVNISRDTAQERHVTYEYAFPSTKEKRRAIEALRKLWTTEQLGMDDLVS